MADLVISPVPSRASPGEWAAALQEVARKYPLDAFAQSLLRTVAAVVAEQAQIFVFGKIPSQLEGSSSRRCANLWSRGHLRTPYRTVIYHWHQVDGPQRFTHIAVTDSSGAATVAVFDAYEVACRLLISVHFEAMPPFPPDTAAVWPAKTLYCALDPPHHDALVSWAGTALLGLSMILCTRGVPVEVQHAPEKVNIKRQKAGKPPLVHVTVVNTATYYETAHNTTRGGTHASPVPHLRRGHVRLLPSGKETWVQDCLVSCRSVTDLERIRDHYEVKT